MTERQNATAEDVKELRRWCLNFLATHRYDLNVGACFIPMAEALFSFLDAPKATQDLRKWCLDYLLRYGPKGVKIDQTNLLPLAEEMSDFAEGRDQQSERREKVAQLIAAAEAFATTTREPQQGSPGTS